LAAIAILVGWFIQSGIAVALIALLIGFVLSEVTQSRTQKRAWKREYAINVVQTVYAPLFDYLKGIVKGLEMKTYYPISFDMWGQIRESHRTLMIDEPFRTKLNEFSEALEKYSLAISDLRNKIIPKMIKAEAKKVFQFENEISDSIITLRGKSGGYGLGIPTLTECMIKQEHPLQFLTKYGPPEIVDVEYYEYQTLDGKQFKSSDMDKLESFSKSCLSLAKENSIVQSVLKENERLFNEAKVLGEELAKRIKEPWKI
jgi:hypothetical protein